MDKSFLELKKHLEESGYSAPLGIESVALVTQLFKDVDKIRSERDEIQKKFEKETDRVSQISETVNTLRRENANLIDAKNALHAEICRNSELMDQVERKAREEVSTTRALANNFRFQLNTAMYQVKAQETDINRLKQKIMSLLEKSHTFAETERVNNISKQRLELTDVRFNLLTIQSMDSGPHFAELLDVAQSKIEALQQQVDHQRGICDELKQQKLSLEKAVAVRDTEVRRKEVDSGSRISSDHRSRQLSDQVDFLTQEMIRLESDVQHYKTMEPLVEKLQIQRNDATDALEKCQKELLALRDELDQEKNTTASLIEEKQRDLNLSKSRIPRAVKELEAAQNTIRRLQAQIQEVELEKKQIEKDYLEIKKIYQSYSSDKSLLSSLVEEAENRAAQTQKQLEETKEQCLALEKQNSNLSVQLQAMRQNTQSFQKEIELHQQTISHQQADINSEKAKNELLSQTISSLEQTVEALSHDGEVLSHRLEQANADNKHLRDTLEDQSAVVASDARKEAAEKSAAQRQSSIIRNLNAERDQYRAQLSEVNDLLSHMTSEKSALERNLGLEKQSRIDAEKHLTEALQHEEELRRLLSQREATILDLKRELQELTHQVVDKQQEIATLKNLCSASGSNVDRLREATSRLIELQRDLNLAKQNLDLQHNENDHLRKQLEDLSKHRDALTVVLREFDAHFVTIQLQAQNLIRERDGLQFQNNQLTAELNLRERSESDFQSRRQHEQQLLSQLKSDNASLVAVIRQHEDQARSHEDLLQSTRADLSDLQSSRESLIRDLQNERRLLSQATTRCGELESQLDLASQDHIRMTKQIGSLQHTIEQQRGTISALRSDADKFQSLITQLENVKTNESAEVARLRASLQAVRDDISQRDEFVSQLEMQLAQSNTQLESLKHVTQNLDTERDRLCHQLDEKCEQLALVQQQLHQSDEAAVSAQQTINQLQERIDELSLHYSKTVEDLKQQAEIIGHLQHNEQSLESQIKLKDSEIQSLTEDLRNMTSENQFVNGELTLALQEKDTKAQEAFGAAGRILYLEELLRVLKHEKEDVLGNYRMLSSENKRLLDTASELDSKCQQQLIEIQRLTERCLISESKAKELTDNNGRLALDIEQYQRSQERLTRSLSTLQEQLNAKNQENQSLMDMMQSSRTLSSGLESDRESLYQQMFAEQNMKNLLQEQVQELGAQIESLTQENYQLLYKIKEVEILNESAPKVSPELQRMQEENSRLKQFIVEYEKKLSSKELAGDEPAEKSPIGPESTLGDIV